MTIGRSAAQRFEPGRLADRIRRRSARRDRGTGQALLLAAFVIAILAAMPLFSAWRLIDNRLFDLMSTTAPVRPSAPGAVIVAIDEPSFAEVGRQWPWPRDLHATLIGRLREAGATVIAFDLIFAEPSAAEADEALARTLGPDIVLAADLSVIETPQVAQVTKVLPLPMFTETGAVAGIASVSLDGDGTLRRVPLHPDGFASVILDRLGHAAPAPADSALLQYFGPPRSYPTVSYYQALDPEAFLPSGFFRGKTVIVGFSLQNVPTPETATADSFATPFTLSTGRLTAGPEIQATILDNLAHDLFIRPASNSAVILALVAGVLLSSLGIWRLGLLRGLALTGGLLLLFVGGSYLGLRYGRVWLPPALPVLGMITVVALQGGRDYLRERALRRDVVRAFGHYLAPALVDRLAREPDRLKLGGERRVLTVLFCDVRGFTALSERLKDDPERLTGLINRLLTPLSEAVLETEGTIDKYIGDCIMAFWNAPLDDPDHAPHAVAAALAMLDRVAALNDQLARETAADRRNLARIEIGIGLNTGECVVGNMGSTRRFNYSALGDAVNLASRLEGASKTYRVPLVIGPETNALVQGAYATLELDEVVVKGRQEAVPIFTVLGRHGQDATRDSRWSQLIAEHGLLRQHYRSCDWDAADDAIERCERLGPELAAYYAMLTARIEALRRHPPPPGWRGEQVLQEK